MTARETEIIIALSEGARLGHFYKGHYRINDDREKPWKGTVSYVRRTTLDGMMAKGLLCMKERNSRNSYAATETALGYLS